MRTRTFRSLSLPIVLSSVSVVLSVAVLVGWIYAISRNIAVTKQVVANVWLLVGGIVSLVTIITVLVLFSVFLAREILEGRRQTRFIDSVTHELRSPLTSLRLCLDTLERPELDNEQRLTLHRMMRDDTERLHVFIEDILRASRLGEKRGQRALESLALRTLIEEVVQGIRQRYGLTDAEIAVRVPEELVWLSDGPALRVILNNLVDNAAKYSGAPREILVEATVEGSRLMLCVRDAGIGVEGGHINRLFGRFYRAPDENVRKRRGTGLGLYVVAELVRDLGGKVKAESAGRNLGTQICVTLPKRRQPTRSKKGRLGHSPGTSS